MGVGRGIENLCASALRGAGGYDGDFVGVGEGEVGVEEEEEVREGGVEGEGGRERVRGPWDWVDIDY